MLGGVHLFSQFSSQFNPAAACRRIFCRVSQNEYHDGCLACGEGGAGAGGRVPRDRRGDDPPNRRGDAGPGSGGVPRSGGPERPRGAVLHQPQGLQRLRDHDDGGGRDPAGQGWFPPAGKCGHIGLRGNEGRREAVPRQRHRLSCFDGGNLDRPGRATGGL